MSESHVDVQMRRELRKLSKSLDREMDLIAARSPRKFLSKADHHITLQAAVKAILEGKYFTIDDSAKWSVLVSVKASLLMSVVPGVGIMQRTDWQSRDNLLDVMFILAIMCVFCASLIWLGINGVGYFLHLRKCDRYRGWLRELKLREITQERNALNALRPLVNDQLYSLIEKQLDIKLLRIKELPLQKNGIED